MTVKIVFILFLIWSFWSLETFAVHPSIVKKEIRVIESPEVPLDPLQIKSMADYNLALLVSRNWFQYDEGRRAQKNIIESWTFNSKTGAYIFEISSLAKWSDGSKITATDLKFNLDRSVFLKTSYGDAIQSLVDLKSFKKIDDEKFELSTNSKLPSASFFERMGSIFLAIVSPKDVDNRSMKVVSNNLSSGPYLILSHEKNIITLQKNKFYENLESSAKSILIDRNKLSFNIDDFLSEKSWNNVYQMTSFVPTSWEEKIKKNGLPYWTRGHDRISLMRPGFGLKSKAGREKLVQLNSLLSNYSFGENLPFNVVKANSLQPSSYPLHHPKVLFQNKKEDKSVLGKISILAADIPATHFHIEVLSSFFRDKKINVVWDLKPFSEYLKLVGSSEVHDIIFLNFGVADPEPATWMSLIKQSKFIDLDSNDEKKFDSILKETNRDKENELFRSLLVEIMNKGGYVPLFYGSTFVMGQRGLSFEKIRELDETVDLSKIIFKPIK